MSLRGAVFPEAIPQKRKEARWKMSAYQQRGRLLRRKGTNSAAGKDNRLVENQGVR